MERKLGPASFQLILFGFILFAAFWPGRLHAQDGDEAIDEAAFDISIIIDNRPAHESEKARAEVDALFTMLDRQMFIEHIMIFERPTIDVICDVFSCPAQIEPRNPFPPLLRQITRERQARVVVYYIGEGRLEGLERQLLFRRRDGVEDHDVVGLPVSSLHEALADVQPKSAVLILDAGFAPRRLPCASADPRLISEALLNVRRDYQQVARRHWNDIGETIELAATTPVQVPHCDRFDRMFEGAETPLFTRFLLRGIVDGEANEDGDLVIRLDELADYLDDRIGRTVRFQWGRRQNVRAIGSRSQALASVEKQTLSDENDKVLKRRQQPVPEDDQPLDDVEVGQPAPGDAERDGQDDATETAPEAGPAAKETGCQEHSEAADCHPCVLDPEGEACADHCREEENADLCAEHLTSGSDFETHDTPAMTTDDVTVVAVPVEEKDDPADAIEEHSAACQFVTDNIAPFASALTDLIGGGTDPSCAWALDRSALELGPIGQIFTPVIWRLGRSYVQDGVSCLLNCDQVATSMPAEPEDGLEQVAWTSTEPPAAPPVDPRRFGPFKREICDQMHAPLPPYIGLPRWMPGTLIISEGLRLGYGCPPPSPPPPDLPMPLVYALEAPAAPKPAEPGHDLSPALLAADERLARWSSLAADVDLRPADEVPNAVSEEPVIEQADATPPPDESGEGDEEPPAEQDLVEMVSRIRWLQSALTLENYHPGPIDGVMGEKTRGAVRAWQRDNGHKDPSGELSDDEFRDIIETFARRFGQLREPVEPF